MKTNFTVTRALVILDNSEAIGLLNVEPGAQDIEERIIKAICSHGDHASAVFMDDVREFEDWDFELLFDVEVTNDNEGSYIVSYSLQSVEAF